MLRAVRTMLCVAALTMLTAGCATTGSSGQTEVCAVWRGIGWSEKDTPKTIEEVKGNNARRRAWCE